MNPIVLSAGGTGGHLFPAQALAGELTRRGRSIVVMTDRRFVHYATQFPGAEIQTVPSSPFNAIAAPFKIAAGVVLAFAKLLRLRPAAVIGFGGYPSVPVMLAANLARLPTAIIEQNAVVGRANRLVMNKVKLVAAAFPIARFAPRDKSKIVLTGNPLRPEVIALWGAPYTPPQADGVICLLVFGGSQGARAFSRIIPAALTRLPSALKRRLRVTQQCRPEDLEAVREIYANAEIRADLAPFFTDLPARMAGSHLVIGRAGAGTVAELMAIGRPAILVPLPYALDDNQTPNAAILADAGAGWRVHEGDLSPDLLSQMLTEIFADPQDLKARAAKAHALAMPNAASNLADLVEGLPARARMKVTTRVPLDIGAIHFIGIGGIGMSGIAEIMHNLGYKVQGSDVSESANVKRLKAMGIKVAIGHSADNLKDAHAVVYSSAVKPGNVEFDAARAQSLPLVRRAEMLAEIMRLRSCVAIAGTNGKTTTTTLVAALLDAGGMDPTVVNGGIINAYGTNARLGAGEWVVVEADESDGTFLRLPATIAVITNADPDHLDFYGTFDAMRDAFQRFAENVPFYGFAVLCLDHPEVQAMVGRIIDRRLITYGFSPQADARAVNVRFSEGASHFDCVFTDRRKGSEIRLDGLSLPMPGEHNVQNAMAAIVVARELGVGDALIRKALAEFKGVGRRFSKIGEYKGVAIIDDYAHNPFKIAAALKAARQAYSGPVIAVVQPHRYTRLRDTFEQYAKCLNDADVAIIAPVYAAGEQPIDGIDRDSYAEALRAHGHRNVIIIEGEADLAAAVAPYLKPGGAVVGLGAGSITGWIHGLQKKLEGLT